MTKNFTEEEISRIIEMAWEDRTPIAIIKEQFKITEKELISIMRKNLKLSSFKMWRERINNRKTKHPKKYNIELDRHHAPTQNKINRNNKR